MAEVLYFAKDGSYGCANDLTILSTEHWSEDEMRQVMQATDRMRWYTAVSIAGEASRRALLAAIGKGEN